MNYPINKHINAIPANPLRRLFEQAKPSALNLASGHPAQAHMDTDGLVHATQKASQDSQSWRYGSSKGDDELIQLLNESLGPADNEDLVVTSGAQQGIDLVLRTLAQPEGILLVPEKAYPAALSAAIMNGLTPVAYRIKEDDETLSELKAALGKITRPCVLYALPTFSNPSSETISIEQRKNLLKLACQFNFPILEDDPYRELWFDSPPPPTLYELNKTLHTRSLIIHLGSFSKIMSPGLRVGWIQGPKELLSHMIRARQASDLQPNSLAQRVAYHHLASGRLSQHLPTLRATLFNVHKAFIAPLRDIGLTQLDVKGGLFVMANIGKNTVAQSLCNSLLADNIIAVPGNAFSLDQTRPSNHIRLCFGSLTQDNAEQAGITLANATRHYL